MIGSKTTRKSEGRRQEGRRLLGQQERPVRQVLRKLNQTTLWLWLAFYIATLTILLAGGESMPRYRNELVQNDIAARVTFQVEDTERTQQERLAAAASAPDIYIQNPAPLATLRADLNDLLAIAKEASEKTPEMLTRKGWSVSPAGIKLLQEYAAEDTRSIEYEKLVKRLIEDLGNQHLVQKLSKPLREGTPPITILRRPNAIAAETDIQTLTSRLQYVGDEKTVRQIVREVVDRNLPEALRNPIADKIIQTILGTGEKDVTQPTPLWRYDLDATKEAIKQAQDRVPVYTFRYQPGDPIVRAGTILSDQKLELLRNEHHAYLQAQKTDPLLYRKKILSQLGLAIVVLLVTIGLVAYVAIYQQRVFQKSARTLGLAGLLLSLVLCSRLLDQMQYPSHPPAELTVGLVVVAAMLLTIAYNQRFAFGASGTLAFLATLASNGNIELFLTITVGMCIAVFALREVRTRSKVVAVGFLAAIGAFIASLATGLQDGQSVRYAIEHATAAAVSTLAAGFLVQGILPTFERWFGIATSMTLLEWSDANQPLLRRLAQEAPGTYSHASILTQMAESVAAAIGANALLTRVGALYHDIGKIAKPEYFVENQEARMNRHDRLSPTMSLLIITGHVRDGLEMAKAYGLPRVLHQFILEHHGTTVVRYFHHIANEAAATKRTGRHDREISENEFRYPGPKPRSRESAILMLCDSCEGAVRALSEPSPGRIESTVHQVLMERLSDGQFEECDITLKDLNLVEQAIVRSLCAIHHGRIKYPKTTSPPSAPSDEPPATKGQATAKANGPADENGRNVVSLSTQEVA